MYTRLLVPLDGSKTAENVLPYARWLAKGLNLPVELLAVIDIVAFGSSLDHERTVHLERILTEQRQAAQRYLETVGRSFEPTQVTFSVQSSTAAEMIVEQAAKDRGTLIAMSTHGRSGVRRWLLGSVTEKVFRSTVNPLLVVHAHQDVDINSDATLKTVVVPLDGSQVAETALLNVVELAKRWDFQVLLVRAFELPAGAYYGSEGYLPNYSELLRNLREEARVYLVSKEDELKAQGVKNVAPVLLEGSGEEEIIKFAHKEPASLIVMCTHGRSGVKRWILGSVTEKVVRHSGVPVLIVRAQSGVSNG
jgi:nucleotide-binding universal stress UspA family protein